MLEDPFVSLPFFAKLTSLIYAHPPPSFPPPAQRFLKERFMYPIAGLAERLSRDFSAAFLPLAPSTGRGLPFECLL